MSGRITAPQVTWVEFGRPELDFLPASSSGMRPYPTNRADVFSPTFHLTGLIEGTRIFGNVIVVPKIDDEIDSDGQTDGNEE